MSRVDRSVGDLVAKLPPDAAVVKCGDLRSAVQTPTVDYGEEHIDGFRLHHFSSYLAAKALLNPRGASVARHDAAPARDG